MKLTKEFFERDTITVAKELLGKYLVREINGIKKIGKIVETEAYLGEHDLAAHSSKGITPRTKVMFGPAGRSYVYLIYGIYHCLNLVTGKEGDGSAVLIRAIEPIENINEKTSGPGLLCNALDIDKTMNDYDISGEKLYVLDNDETFEIESSPRVGVDYAKDWAKKPLRFYIKNNKFVSRIRNT